MKEYNFKNIEQKWQDNWNQSKPFAAIDFSPKPKYYVLSEFPGPSAKGIHLGHARAYTPSDVVARYKRLKGFNVLYPTGWDAFGLPTENYAIKTNTPPEIATNNNIKLFINQLTKLGLSFDWSREINTTDPSYYKWTQWIFLQLFKHGMAYKAKAMVNFCPSCQTVLSNEDSQDGICDRCKSGVEQQERDVWFLKMKDYSEKMLDGIDSIEMREHLKLMQRNWIGKSTGCEITFNTNVSNQNLVVYTTRPDTLFGATFMVVAPEHSLIESAKTQIKNYEQVLEYRNKAAHKTSLERGMNQDKTGIKLEGVYGINPVTKKPIPIFVADYVMMGYGTGAIMAVPAHDERDYMFAKTHGVDIIEVISGGDIEKEAYSGDGILVNSDFLNGLSVEDAKQKITTYLEQHSLGVEKTNYKMQDWPFNRQRYWGEPFPIVNCNKCGTVALPEDQLPLTLPKLDDFKPSADGQSPLAKATEWVNTTCPKCGGPAKRETDTMPNWAGSSWYWLRFMDSHNNTAFASMENLKYWSEVDLYTGGVEHVTRHMLYASFWHNFLFDIGAVPNKLPFLRRMCNGLILAEGGKKMGKSSGNAVDPLDIIDQFGADAFRLHMLFIGDYEMNTVWSLDGITGCTRFLQNVWNLQNILINNSKPAIGVADPDDQPTNTNYKNDATSTYAAGATIGRPPVSTSSIDTSQISPTHEVLLHALIKKSEESIENFSFNTFIAELMKCVSAIKQSGHITKEELKWFLLALNPYAPHITSEIFENVFQEDITSASYPQYEENKTIANTVDIPVQVNGKVKGRITAPLNSKESFVTLLALQEVGIENPKKVIYVKNKIINIIV